MIGAKTEEAIRDSEMRSRSHIAALIPLLSEIPPGEIEMVEEFLKAALLEARDRVLEARNGCKGVEKNGV